MTTSDWHELHEEIIGLARRGAEQDHAVGRALVRALRNELWLQLGLDTIEEYAKRFLGLTARQTWDRIRLAQALEALPLTDVAFRRGDLCFTAALQLSRVATPESEEAWLGIAKGKTAWEIQRMVAGRAPGDHPVNLVPAEERRKRLVIEISPETYSTYREAQTQLRRNGLSEEQALLRMARSVLSVSSDDVPTAFQVRMPICRACGIANENGDSEPMPVNSGVAERAQCGEQAHGHENSATQSVSTALRRFIRERQHGRCAAPGCTSTAPTELHRVNPRATDPTRDANEMVLLCARHHDACHRSVLRIDGTWLSGFRYQQANGLESTVLDDGTRTGVFEDARMALLKLGFTESAARTAMERLRSPDVGARIALAEEGRPGLESAQDGAAGQSSHAADVTRVLRGDVSSRLRASRLRLRVAEIVHRRRPRPHARVPSRFWRTQSGSQSSTSPQEETASAAAMS